MKLKAKLTAAAMVLTLLTGCNSTINANTYKAYFQLAAQTFISTEATLNPGWNSAKLASDVNGLIAVWNVGTNWQTNAINELMMIQGDVADIPNCDNQCQVLALVFAGAVATGIAIAQANTSPVVTGNNNQVTITNDSVVRPKGKVYTTRDQYKADWNKVAPEGHKL